MDKLVTEGGEKSDYLYISTICRDMNICKAFFPERCVCREGGINACGINCSAVAGADIEPVLSLYNYHTHSDRLADDNDRA